MSAWNDDRLTLLKILWPEGRSAEWIARELGGGLTRNAVLGQVRRLGLSARDTSDVVRRDRRPRTSTPVPPPPSQGSATILSVRRTQCRWPYGDPSGDDFRLCGCAIQRGAFCAAHAALAYRLVPQSAESLMALAGVFR